jgi:hypothetical protein
LDAPPLWFSSTKNVLVVPGFDTSVPGIPD